MQDDVYEALFEQLPDPVVIVDDDNRMLRANRAARALEIDFGKLLSTGQSGEASDRAGTGGGHPRRVVSSAGVRHEFELTQLTLCPGCHAVLLRDASQERELESEVAHLRRVESLGFLTASVVHDFNNMLTPMLYYSGVLGKELDPASSLAGLARQMQTAAERAASLVRQLLAYVQREPGRPSLLNVGGVIAELRPLLERAAGENVEVGVTIDDTAVDVNVDRDQLEQLVMNLVVNARDAMPRGGGVMIEVAAVTLSPTEARSHGCPAPGDYVALSVTDTGIGMAPELRERIFERFFSTKARGVNSGLGLATAHRFAAQSRGCITVHSEPGRGSTITVYLPKVSADAPLTARSAPELAHGSETVLVVDDDEGVLGAVRDALERLGYHVVCAASAADALVLFGKNDVDLIITDVVMPTMGGRELVEACGARNVAVLYMSGHADGSVREHGVDPSGPLLRKAFSKDELARRVRSALDAMKA